MGEKFFSTKAPTGILILLILADFQTIMMLIADIDIGNKDKS